MHNSVHSSFVVKMFIDVARQPPYQNTVHSFVFVSKKYLHVFLVPLTLLRLEIHRFDKEIGRFNSCECFFLEKKVLIETYRRSKLPCAQSSRYVESNSSKHEPE